MQDRQSNASNDAKQDFLVRKDDINLGKWWNAMRLNQREIQWKQRIHTSQHANAVQLQSGYANKIGFMGLSNIFPANQSWYENNGSYLSDL